jgi:6-phospho-beta-glucosidase
MTAGTSARVLTVVGGGAHVASLLAAAASRPDLPRLDIRLVARDPDRLGTIGRHVAAALGQTRPEWSVRTTTDLADGAQNADAVVLLVRVGGAAARAHDERFPTECGLVGDEGIGAGGIANAWRTAPVLRDMAGVLAAAAPRALVLNMVAPLGLTTRVLGDGGVRAVGVCELPSVVLGDLVAAGADGASMSVGGLNHLSWVWPTNPGDPSAESALLEAGLAAGAVDRATFERFGGVPMPYYYRVVDPAAGRALGIRQPPGRAEQLASLSDRALARMRTSPGDDVPELAERPTPWFDLATVPVLAAWLGGRRWTGMLNVLNDGLLDSLDANVVAEVPASVGGGTIHANTPGRPPGPIGDFLAAWSRTEALTHRAVTTRDPVALEQAIASLPLALPPGSVQALSRSVLDRRELAA